jgi:hypothetical protein
VGVDKFPFSTRSHGVVEVLQLAPHDNNTCVVRVLTSHLVKTCSDSFIVIGGDDT